MATTSATGNQGSTGDQDPEPQQELISPGAGIRPPATARAGDAGRRLAQEEMARDQADQARAPVHLDGNWGRANRRRAARRGRRQPRQDAEADQGGDPVDQYEGRQARNAAGDAGVRQAKERRKPAVETDLGGLFDFHQDETKDAARCLLKNRALASTTPSRRRRLSWWSPRLPTAPAMKAGDAGAAAAKARLSKDASPRDFGSGTSIRPAVRGSPAAAPAAWTSYPAA